MMQRFRTIALAGALTMVASQAFAFSITLPFIGDPMNPDLDPLHILTPAPAAAPEAAPAKPVMKHKHHMKKKMMKKKM